MFANDLARQTARLACCAAVLSSLGCNEKLALAPVTGTVVYQGETLEFGGVMTQPITGGPVARSVIENGRFALKTGGQEGAVPGVHRVRVTCFTHQKPGAIPSSADGEAPLGRSLIPDHYNQFSSSSLTIDVKPGENESLVIELE